MKTILIFILLAFNNYLFAEKIKGDKFTVKFCKNLANQTDCLQRAGHKVTNFFDYSSYISILHRPYFKFQLYFVNKNAQNLFLDYLRTEDGIELFVKSSKSKKCSSKSVNARDVMIKAPGENKLVSLREFAKRETKRIKEESKKASLKKWKKWFTALPATWNKIMLQRCNPF